MNDIACENFASCPGSLKRCTYVIGDSLTLTAFLLRSRFMMDLVDVAVEPDVGAAAIAWINSSALKEEKRTG